MGELDTQNIQVLEASKKDAGNILAIEKESWLATYVNEDEEITAEDISNRFLNRSERISGFEKSITEQDHQFYIAKLGTRIVGYMHLLKGEQYNGLVEIYILPEFQGQGIGRMFLKTALEWLGKEKPILLDVVAYNTRARAIYKKYGFVENPEMKQPADETWNVLPSGKRLPIIFMVKEF